LLLCSLIWYLLHTQIALLRHAALLTGCSRARQSSTRPTSLYMTCLGACVLSRPAPRESLVPRPPHRGGTGCSGLSWDLVYRALPGATGGGSTAPTSTQPVGWGQPPRTTGQAPRAPNDSLQPVTSIHHTCSLQFRNWVPELPLALTYLGHGGGGRGGGVLVCIYPPQCINELVNSAADSGDQRSPMHTAHWKWALPVDRGATWQFALMEAIFDLAMQRYVNASSRTILNSSALLLALFIASMASRYASSRVAMALIDMFLYISRLICCLLPAQQSFCPSRDKATGSPGSFTGASVASRAQQGPAI
jgi:hypothetical protein